MKKIIILSFMALLSIQSVFSQRGLHELMNEYYKDRQKRMRVSDYSGVDGSPYLFNDFRIGRVYMKSKKDYGMNLRFNLYEDKFEFKVDSAIYFINNPGEVDKIEMNGATFVYFKLNRKFHYVELIASGKANLICRKVVVLIEGEKPEAYSEPKSPYFRRKNDAYYIIDKESNISLINNRSTIIEIFNDKKADITKFIKKERLKLKRRTD